MHGEYTFKSGGEFDPLISRASHDADYAQFYSDAFKIK